MSDPKSGGAHAHAGDASHGVTTAGGHAHASDQSKGITSAGKAGKDAESHGKDGGPKNEGPKHDVQTMKGDAKGGDGKGEVKGVESHGKDGGPKVEGPKHDVQTMKGDAKGGDGKGEVKGVESHGKDGGPKVEGPKHDVHLMKGDAKGGDGKGEVHSKESHGKDGGPKVDGPKHEVVLIDPKHQDHKGKHGHIEKGDHSHGHSGAGKLDHLKKGAYVAKALMDSLFGGNQGSGPGKESAGHRVHDHQGGFRFRVEMGGVQAGAFRSVDGLSTTVELIEYQGGGDMYARQIPGRPKIAPVVLKKGYVNTAMLWDWMHATMEGKFRFENVSVVLLDDDGKTELDRYELLETWPTRWAGWQLDANSANAMVEEFELQVHRIKRVAG